MRTDTAPGAMGDRKGLADAYSVASRLRRATAAAPGCTQRARPVPCRRMLAFFVSVCVFVLVVRRCRLWAPSGWLLLDWSLLE